MHNLGVTGTSFISVTQLTSFFNPSTTADPRARGSVRRASGFVQIPIEALKTTRERAGAGYRGLPGAFKMRRMAAIVFQLRVVAGAP